MKNFFPLSLPDGRLAARMSSRVASQIAARPDPRPSRDTLSPLPAPSNATTTAHTTATTTDLPGSLFEKLHAARRVFWCVYGEWMSRASERELEQLDNALHEHAPHVRPIHAAIGDAMRSPASRVAMPLSLLAALDAAGWSPDDLRAGLALSKALPSTVGNVATRRQAA